MQDRIAIIDLGTNTFHLLIAQVGGREFMIIHNERLAVKIGKGGINQSLIQPDALDRAVNALKDFKDKIDKFSVSKIYAFGTSALRNAKNASEVVAVIKQKTEIDIHIISGEQEAEYIYLGVRSAVSLGNEPCLIIDIGGGSVEFIIGNATEIYWKRSFEIGAQRLLEEFQKNDPITPEEISTLNAYFDHSLTELHTAIKLYQPAILVGSSGTFDTLSDIHCFEGNITKRENDHETPLTIQSFFSIYKNLILKNRTERMLIPGMIEMRVDMIVVACCLIRYLLEMYPFSFIRVSSYALKEGVLASLQKEKP